MGLSILFPFTFALDPFTALAMLLGLSAVTVTSAIIPAILFSMPGTVGAAATNLDGFPMTQKGQAGRALGAAFTASMIGGLFGAVLLGVSIPELCPLVLLIGAPKLQTICIFGLSLVAVLSDPSPLKGTAAAVGAITRRPRCVQKLEANVAMRDHRVAAGRYPGHGRGGHLLGKF